MKNDHFKYKEARNWAYGICHKFVSSAEYFALVADETRTDSFEVDFLEPEILPIVFSEERNFTLVRYCVDSLLSKFNEGGYPDLQLATMNVSFKFTEIERHCFAEVALEFEGAVCVNSSYAGEVVYLERH